MLSLHLPICIPAPAQRQHHVTLHETDADGRMFVHCKAGCGRAEVETFERIDGARRYLDAAARAKGERADHGVMPAPAPLPRRRRRTKQRRLPL